MRFMSSLAPLCQKIWYTVQSSPFGDHLQVLLASRRVCVKFAGRVRRTFRGITVRTAANAAQARAALAEQDFSLVLFDLNLPDGCGTDLIREVAERSPKESLTPVRM